MNNQPNNKCDLIIACIGNNQYDENILNLAYKESRLANCKWNVLHVSEGKKPAYNNSKVHRLIKKAHILNAKVVLKNNNSIAEGIIEYAKTLNVKNRRIVFFIGSSPGFPARFFRSISRQVKKTLADMGIIVRLVAHDRSYNNNPIFISPIFNFDGLPGILEAVISVLIAFLAAYLLQHSIPQPDYAMSDYYLIYTIACIIASVRGGIIPGMIAAVLSLVSLNFFFIQPVNTLQISSSGDVSNLLFFFAAAISVSLICSGSRRYIIDSRQKEAYLNALLNVSETLNRPFEKREALIYIHHELQKLFSTEIAFFTPTLMSNGSLQLAYSENTPSFNDSDRQALETCRTEYRSIGYLTATNSTSKWYFEPMMSATGFQGVLALKLAESPRRHDKNVIPILLGFADLSATIIDRIEHTQSLEETRLTEEKEKLRTMLLSSVSHDLKTPLASIIGSLDVYHNLNAKLTAEAKTSLTETALQEARRLDNFITNILDMAKLESGSVKFNKDWHKAESLIDRALTNSRHKLGARITNHITADNYEVEIDYNMMLRALANLFDNISKYTPENSKITINYGPDESGKFAIIMQDSGPGIDETMLEQIFNKYTRIKKKDSIVAGTGLGLPISRSIVESHGGSITASNNYNQKGASFKIILPNFRKQNI